MFGDAARPAKHLWNNDAAAAAGDQAAAKVYTDAPTVVAGPDVAKAKQLLQEAGYNGTPIKFVYTSGVSASVGQIATYVQQAAKNVGLTIELNDVAPQVIGQLSSDASTRAKYDLGFTLGPPNLPDPLFRAQNLLVSTPANYLKYNNPSVAADLAKARQTTDPSARAALVLSAEKTAANDAPIIPVLDLYNLVYVSNQLTGVPLSSIHTSTAWAATLGGK